MGDMDRTESPFSGVPLVILDVQHAIDQPIWNEKNNPDYINAIVRLLTFWRDRKRPVIHIRHDEATPTSTYHTHGPWNGFKTEVTPIAGETTIAKQQNCAFIGTELDAALKDLNADHFALTGVVIHNSMDATIRAGKALGYTIYVPSDATTAVPVVSEKGTRWDADTVFELTLAILDGEYAHVTTSDEVISAG